MVRPHNNVIRTDDVMREVSSILAKYLPNTNVQLYTESGMFGGLGILIKIPSKEFTREYELTICEVTNDKI